MTIQPQHIKPTGGRIAEAVLTSGDPERLKELSKLLDNVKVINTYRYVVYTGEYRGTPVSLMSHGIGAPSLAIAVEEAHAFGANKIIRLGTCGGLQTGQTYGDVVIPNSASSDPGGTIGVYASGINLAPAPDFGLTSALIKGFSKTGIRYHVGPVFSADAFYAESKYAPELARMNFVGIEMECAALFMLGQIRGFKTASALMVVDNQNEKLPFMPVEEMHKIAKETGRIVLDVLAGAK